MSIGKFCNRNVVCATRSTTIAAAAALMRKSHVGNVVLVDESAGGRRPVGIVTDRDIVIEVVAAGLDPAQVALSEVALRPLVTIGESASHGEAVRAMAAQGVRRLPVIDGDGNLFGIITLDDLLRQLALPLAELSELAVREIRYETRTRS